MWCLVGWCSVRYPYALRLQTGCNPHSTPSVCLPKPGMQPKTIPRSGHLPTNICVGKGFGDNTEGRPESSFLLLTALSEEPKSRMRMRRCICLYSVRTGYSFGQ